MTPARPKLRPPTPREVALLGLAGLVFLGLGYLRLRWKPARAEAAALAESAEAVDAQAAMVRNRAAAVGGGRPLDRAHAEMAAALEAERRALAAVEARFAPDDSLAADLAALARDAGVEIRESAPGEGRAGDPYARPVRRLVVKTSFAGLRAFVAGLAGLRYRATVVRIEVEAGPPLVATLVLAL